MTLHELGLCEDLLVAVERRAAGRRVTHVTVRAGALHRVVEPALAQSFELVSAGGVADGATVALVTVPVRASCGVCEAETTSDDVVSVCGACGSTDVTLEGGDELLLESITLDQTT